ncbi:MAG: TIGR04149 family rSAM-modified RiPP [Parabacteroides sp.]
MKKLENLKLKVNAKVLNASEMKMLRGGSVWCHCLGDSGEGRSATKCSDCPSICSNGVQNCNYVA